MWTFRDIICNWNINIDTKYLISVKILKECTVVVAKTREVLLNL